MNIAALTQSSWHDQAKRDQLHEFIAEKSVKRGDFQLASGAKSDIFFDMKQTLLDPEGLELAADLLMDIIDQFPKVDAVGGLVIGACPIVDAICQKSITGRPLYGFHVRKEKKTTGTEQLIEGPVKARSNVIVLDDVTTRGGSVLKAIHAVQEELNCNVVAVITIIDREEGTKEMLATEDLQLISLFVKSDFE